MSRTVLKIERTDAMGLNATQHSLVVTAAGVDGFFTRLKPSYRKQHASLRNQIVETLAKEYALIRERRLRRYAQIHQHPSVARHAELATEEVQHRSICEQFGLRLLEYKLDTLDVLSRLSGSELLNITIKSHLTETQMRELLFLPLVLELPTKTAQSLLDDVRQAGPQFAFEDLSEMEEADRVHACRIVEMSLFLWKRGQTPEKEMLQHIRTTTGVKEIREQFVSAAFAALLRDREDVIDHLPEYLESCPVPQNEAEVEHLKDFMDTPSKALSVGVL